MIPRTGSVEKRTCPIHLDLSTARGKLWELEPRVGMLVPWHRTTGRTSRTSCSRTSTKRTVRKQDATLCGGDLAEGKGDVENVVLAAKKAETAFQMLQALRNRVVEAYDEIKQMRV